MYRRKPVVEEVRVPSRGNNGRKLPLTITEEHGGGKRHKPDHKPGQGDGQDNPTTMWDEV